MNGTDKSRLHAHFDNVTRPRRSQTRGCLGNKTKMYFVSRRQHGKKDTASGIDVTAIICACSCDFSLIRKASRGTCTPGKAVRVKNGMVCLPGAIGSLQWLALEFCYTNLSTSRYQVTPRLKRVCHTFLDPLASQLSLSSAASS